MKSPKPVTHKPATRKPASPAAKSKPAKGRFTVQRIVNWGDCDPAGIIYTPRVLDYACETIDAWLREEMKSSWWHGHSSGKGPGLPTVHASCDFISILRPDQRLDLTLYIRKIGTSSIAFEVEALAEGGRLAFRVKMVSCTIELVHNRATPIPEWMRKKLEAYQKVCA